MSRIDFEQYRDPVTGNINLADVLQSELVFGLKDADTPEGELELALQAVNFFTSNTAVTSRQVAIAMCSFATIVSALNTRIARLEREIAARTIEALLEEMLANSPPSHVVQE